MRPESDDVDLKLIRAMAQGDGQALESLYARHGLSLLNYLIGQVGDAALAEEILQNVMLAVWNAAGKFRAESKVRTWLIAIARNHAINARRKYSPISSPLHEADAVQKTEPIEIMVRDSERAQVQAALARLPDEQRETLELVFYHGLTGYEAAEILGVSPGTVKSRLHRAKATLKQLLAQEERHHG